VRFRGLFVGGVLDGQERVLAGDYARIQIPRQGEPQYDYRLLFAYGAATLVYSLYGTEETLNRLWHRYSGEDHA